MTKRKVILTCAINGDASRHEKYPCDYPVAPEQICENVVAVAKLGVKPDIETCNPGDVSLANQLIKDEFIDGVPMMRSIMGVQ